MMEGILIEMESFTSVGVFFAGRSCGVGGDGDPARLRVRGGEQGNRLFWAEWPLPGTEKPVSPAIEREYLKAA